VKSDPQFVIHTGVDVVEVEGDHGRFAAVVTRDSKTGARHRFPAAAAVVFIGMRPNTEFLGADFERDDSGFLVTGPTMQTSVAGVFAAGDVRSGSTKQLGSAVGDGIAALLMTRRYLEAGHHKAKVLVDA
jgi:thioredoxin reductase (NADPH)